LGFVYKKAKIVPEKANALFIYKKRKP